MRFGLYHDFRNPAPWREPFERLYAAVFNQITLAESLGWGSVWLTEHHFSDDGYLPQPLTVAANIAARTTTMNIGTSVALLPLADPVKLAEDAALLSIMSDGRFDLGVGLGYRPEEFAGFRRNRAERVGLLEEGIEILRQAWSGEPVAFRGRHYDIPGVVVTPTPARVPRLLIGGVTQAAVERAVRLGDGFTCGSTPQLDTYRAVLNRFGKSPETGDVRLLIFALISEDPEKAWSALGDHALYQMNRYLDWGAFGPPEILPRLANPDQVLESGMYVLWDADRAVSELTQLLDTRPEVNDIHFWGKLPGEPIDSANERLHYITDHVLSKLGSTSG